MTRRSRIPRFPAFKRLERGDREEVERLTAVVPPYSDFNFVSLWCWDTDDVCEISRLNDNLVVKLKDYATDEVFLSFLGLNAVPETATALLAFARQQGIEPSLRLVPAEVIEANRDLRRHVSVVEDPGSFDYVLSIEEWVGLHGGKFRNKRNAIHGFERKHAPEFRLIDVHSRQIQREMVQVFLLWSEKKKRFGLGETRNELLAMRRAFSVDRVCDLTCFGVYEQDVMRGFSINQMLGDGYAMGHFWKADHSLSGIYAYMLHNSCRYFADRQLRFFNIEQDLGKSGLAFSKHLYRPAHLFRKYAISPLSEVAATEQEDGARTRRRTGSRRPPAPEK